MLSAPGRTCGPKRRTNTPSTVGDSICWNWKPETRSRCYGIFSMLREFSSASQSKSMGKAVVKMVVSRSALDPPPPLYRHPPLPPPHRPLSPSQNASWAACFRVSHAEKTQHTLATLLQTPPAALNRPCGLLGLYLGQHNFSVALGRLPLPWLICNLSKV